MAEYLWYTIAAALAGVGTGLAGLSAATCMVPILIVLCPSFAGETGAYQATAIALASDIFGPAVTTATYIRHKNIDLKRGWIMLVCIISMCTVGSFVAWMAGTHLLYGSGDGVLPLVGKVRQPGQQPHRGPGDRRDPHGDGGAADPSSLLGIYQQTVDRIRATVRQRLLSG